MLLQQLDDCSLLRELFPYFTIKDICQLLSVNKTVQVKILNINKLISHKIILSNLLRLTNEEDQTKMLENMLKSFPNIWNLEVNNRIEYDFISIYYSKCLSVLYNYQSVCQSLTELILPCLSDNGIVGISNLKKLKVLNIRCSDITNRGLAEICSIVSITSLNISRCDIIKAGDESAYYYLLKLNNLISLNMSGCDNISDEGLEVLSTITTLTELNLSNCTSISNIGLLYLLSLTNLSILNLSNSYGITSVSSLSTLSNLTSLDLMFSHQLEEIIPLQTNSKPFPNLTNLNLSFCQKITEIGFSSLSLLTKITTLNLQFYNQLTDNKLLLISNFT